MKQTKKTWAPYAVAAAVALAIAAAVSVHQGLRAGLSAALACRYLSDGFFVSGMLLTGFGGLIWISTTGFFDIFSYGFKSLLVLFSPLKKPHEHEKFYEYKMTKDAKRGKPQFSVLFVGLGCVALSLLCLMMYYNLPV